MCATSTVSARRGCVEEVQKVELQVMFCNKH